MEKLPQFIFGIISDIQYADHDDLHPIHSLKQRYYRNALVQTSLALKDCENASASFMIQLGDIIDGKSKSESVSALTSVLDLFKSSSIPVYHTLGNHELYNFTREEALDRLFQGGDSYYSFEKDSFSFICLNTYDLSLLGVSKDSEEYRQAAEYLKIRSPNERFYIEGLSGEEQRFNKLNGAIQMTQLSWLTQQLDAAVELNQKVILYGHASIHPKVAHPMNVIWNYPEVLDIIESCPAVVLVLSGHSHCYGSVTSDSGKLYVCMPGVVETSPAGKCWGMVKVFSDSLDMLIHDEQDSHRLFINF